MARPLNRLVFLSASLLLLVIAFPLISVGTTRGLSWMWWLGLAALFCGGLLPPIYRVLSGRSTEVAVDEASGDTPNPKPEGASR